MLRRLLQSATRRAVEIATRQATREAVSRVAFVAGWQAERLCVAAARAIGRRLYAHR